MGLYQSYNHLIEDRIQLVVKSKLSILNTPISVPSDKITYNISSKVKQKLISKIERENNVEVAALNVSDFVKVINVKESLIIHDKNDVVIPIQQSKNVHNHWNQSTFQEITGTGHFRILRTEKVLQTVCEFMK